jgi:uncharacterized protein
MHLFLIWNGDILTEYSLAGFIVLPFLWGPRWLLAIGALLFLGLYLAMPLLPPPVSWPTTAWMKDHVVEARQIYGTGGFADILAFRIREALSILLLHVFIFPRTLALFLFGMLVWRSGVIRQPAAHRFLLGGVAIVGILCGGVLTLAGGSQALLERLATVVLAIGYAAAVICLVNTPRGKSMLAWAAPLGRMAFTNYLAQSIIFGWIFYGYGLGLFGRLGVAAALAIGIGVYVAQVMLSALWLRHYRFGPVEWLWRTLMYGTPQRLHAGMT